MIGESDGLMGTCVMMSNLLYYKKDIYFLWRYSLAKTQSKLSHKPR